MRHAGDRSPVLILVALASIGVAAVHVAVVPEHADWWASAAFFAAVATFQLLYAVDLLARRARRGLLSAGVAVNAATLAVWLVSRTAGMPFGPHGGQAEAFARADVLTAVLETFIVAGSVWALRRRAAAAHRRRAHEPRVRSAVATWAAASLVSAVSVLALSGAPAHADAPGHSHGADQSAHAH